MSLVVSDRPASSRSGSVQDAVPRAVCNGVQLRATLWDGFVGSNVGFFADGTGRKRCGGSSPDLPPSPYAATWANVGARQTRRFRCWPFDKH